MLSIGWGDSAVAHTDSDLVAVPTGAQATVTLKPTHGCGESPTVRVRIRVPFDGAVAAGVDGWTASATPDGNGNTVLEWSDGALPATETGAFPAEFFVDSEPGTLLTFPAVQVCANGDELAWIDGDPAGEYPAPRLLVLPAGFEAAETIDDVPVDTPGRNQLVEIVDVDNASDTTTTVLESTAPPTSAPTSLLPASTETVAPTSPPATSVPVPPPPETTVSAPVSNDDDIESDDGSGSGSGVAIAAVIGGLVVVAGAIVVVLRKRSAQR